MPRRRLQEEVNHERWLVSYSDFITLLFAFFVVMYSISQVNEGKYRVLSETLNSAFTHSSEANKVPLTLKPIQVGHPERHSSPGIVSDDSGDAAETALPQPAASMNDAVMDSLSERLGQEFPDLIDQELILIQGNELWLEVELKSNILFDSADAVPSSRALEIFRDMATLLQGYDNEIRVEGFTDNLPIATHKFPSNWELSSARAVTVVKLLAESGIKPHRLSAVGYGSHRPIADNTTEQGRAANRRVVLMIAREGQRERLKNVTSSVERSSTDEQIEPVETNGGGWLFSSNPELPRLPN
ncbi:flagellar motor protein MotD [Aestuariicella sp. G3-2]|uniref:flagellar motor protein MotD n=1 Tax=Pseudomaricurvus albidus TaxID=2842452 RepID=UPI001C0A95DD|nr:flagellar motor protein MotD [Aestuariicella albida]MBU3071197.1 flagellar motor protein MotD [Aestuariicella albida]